MSQRSAEIPLSRAGQARKSDPAQVAQRAYERFVQRGGEHGHDQEDWLEAEKELGHQ
ncbi:MAG: DUF2934 domain-containing protein [Deltaproteobacteria bacterium]|nr:MAG: DUF2934 domain-containing protein [Deltaproteobacteria bacterium]